MMIALPTHKQRSRYLRSSLGLLMAAALAGCAFQSYTPKPIQAASKVEAFEHRSIDDPKFAAFLTVQTGQAISFPIEQWDLTTLTYTAHYFHPDLNTARAEWQLAEAKTQTAKQKKIPTVNGSIARSNRANGDINPFAYGFSIDLPIITHGKRQINIDGFQHLSRIAKLKIAQAAWQLRQALANTLVSLQDNALQSKLAVNTIRLNAEIVAMLEKRLQYGEASSLEVATAKRQLQLSEALLQNLQQKAAPLKAQLAKNTGLPLSQVNTMSLAFDGLASPDSMPDLNVDPQTLQASALLNRLDIRTGLAKYDIAENNLKLAIAKQYPDISISPGVGYEFGDHVWSLGFSSLLSLIKKNKAGIAEAEALRTLSAAKFEQLQTNVIAETNIAYAQYVEANHQLQARQSQLSQTKAAFGNIARQFDAGIIDRLTLTLAKLDTLADEKQLIEAVKQLNLTQLNLENSLQKPLLTELNP